MRDTIHPQPGSVESHVLMMMFLNLACQSPPKGSPPPPAEPPAAPPPPTRAPSPNPNNNNNNNNNNNDNALQSKIDDLVALALASGADPAAVDAIRRRPGPAA